MTSPATHHRARTLVLALLTSVLWAAAPARAAPLAVHVSGNHFVNGAGHTIRLLGVDHPSFEYACDEGYAYDDGHMDDADAAAIAAWHANAVRVPLNEDCWLGLNGQPNSNQGADPPLTRAGYRHAVEDYVADLHAHGLYAILDLHWSAPGAADADGQQPMPDDHSPAFWTSVATTFTHDPAVVFDVFNEPFSPNDPRSGDDPDPAHAVSWDCWENGGCTTDAYQGTDTRTATTYTAVGMQALVTAIRGAGASQPVMVGGLDYANDLSRWTTHAPDDPLNQEAASFHLYQGKACAAVACWNARIAPVAAHVPVVTGEFGEHDFLEARCGNRRPTTFDADYMHWADAHGVGYLAWGWYLLSRAERDGQACSAYELISDARGTPAAPNGTAVHDHLAALATGGATGRPGAGRPSLRRFAARLARDGHSVRLRLTSTRSASAALGVRTTGRYVVSRPGGKPRRATVALGTARVRLRAGRATTVTVRVSRRGRALLARHRPVPVRVTITLRTAATVRITGHRTLTLLEPRPASRPR